MEANKAGKKQTAFHVSKLVCHRFNIGKEDPKSNIVLSDFLKPTSV